MRCAVKNCSNNNDSKVSSLSFFTFPANIMLQKKWMRFCCRDENFNTKTSVICMDHFKSDDFSNDMGFTKRRLLKNGAVPTIKKQSPKSERLFKEREPRIEKRENKKTVQMLIKKYEAATSSAEETPNPVPEQLKEFENPVEFCSQSLPSCSKKEDREDDIERLKNEIQFLRGENKELKTAKRRLEVELNALSEKMENNPK